MQQPLSRFPVTGQIKRSDPQSHRWTGRLLLLAILVLLGAILWNRQTIADWIQLYGYAPPARITQFARQTTMTAPAKHLFYLNKPIIATKSNFGKYCTNREQTIVLGCYHVGQDGIYLLQIADNSELHGVMQVTAAHEMLHAAYDRLAGDEKSRVNKLLQEYYDSGLHDKAIRNEVNAYKTTEPGELLNEMHSIFGTEVPNLPAGLEQYYRQYFSDRSVVVRQAEQYQQAFRSREAAVKRYDAQLNSLQQQIDSQEAALTAQAEELQRQKVQLDAYRSSGKISQYNAAVPAYNNLVRTYNSLLATIKREISQYNVIVQKRNALVVEEKQLVKQLSGSDLPSAQ